MKRLLQTLTIAAAIGTPVVLLAADPINEDILNDEQAALILNNAGPTGPTNFGPREGAAPRDASGILMHGGSAYVVQKLGSDLSLPDGSTVQPDGTILGNDGSQKLMSSGQMLSLDGQVKSSPFGGTADVPFSLETSSPWLAPFQNSPPGINDSATIQAGVENENGDFSD